MRYLGLDLGGTNIKAAVLEIGDDADRPAVVWTGSEPTIAERGPDAVTTTMIELGKRAVAETGPIDGVGVGLPGLFDNETGEVIFLTNLPGAWEGHPLRTEIARGLGVSATLINDARAFTLAEGTVGAGRGSHTLVCMTLGTGVGGGIMIEGKLHFGAFGTAGEIGHMTVMPGGALCGCGNRGCLEAMTRAPAIADAAGKDSFEAVLEGLEAGDQRSIEALDTAIDHLAVGLAGLLTVIGPDRIVIGGGVAQAGDVLFDRIRGAVRAKVTLVPPDQIEIVPAELGPEAGAIGAAVAAVVLPLADEHFIEGEIPSAARRRGE